MKLENQVVSLDIAKRLKELGVKQESLFWYANFYRDYQYDDLALPCVGKYKSLQIVYGYGYPSMELESEADELTEEEKESMQSLGDDSANGAYFDALSESQSIIRSLKK